MKTFISVVAYGLFAFILWAIKTGCSMDTIGLCAFIGWVLSLVVCTCSDEKFFDVKDGLFLGVPYFTFVLVSEKWFVREIDLANAICYSSIMAVVSLLVAVFSRSIFKRLGKWSFRWGVIVSFIAYNTSLFLISLSYQYNMIFFECQLCFIIF